MINSNKELSALIEAEIVPEFGKKLLEFGSCGCSAADTLITKCDCLALTDKDPAFSEKFSSFTGKPGIQLIPDSELGEDCYFGRFHLVYTLFGFHGLHHLVDEIMRLIISPTNVPGSSNAAAFRISISGPLKQKEKRLF